ncbi:hypothetical protein [Longimicrobium sp.]|uniref:SLOG cluster 4 domain-containing protein n=1 Tax=Longimicrobium sp. TaxID=2029185 RepID=UPI002E357FC2|nr:hypothetical protein [Longimicrobium sp.]HEX6039861.1 hypothetical protein [Longimicrobium sp.]
MQQAPSRNWAIIGVVGATQGATPALVTLAQAVGMEIAMNGDAVLTGGHHRHSEQSVKFAALQGAVNVTGGPAPRRVRLIGIVPRSISRALKPQVTTISVETQPSRANPLRYLYVHTQLESPDRDPITGQAVDALVALTGGAGTAREVSTALGLGRPVVFLDSWTTLKPLLKRSVVPSQPLKAANALQAVTIIRTELRVGTANPSLTGTFPDLKAAYEAGLLTM